MRFFIENKVRRFLWDLFTLDLKDVTGRDETNKLGVSIAFRGRRLLRFTPDSISFLTERWGSALAGDSTS